MTKFSAKTTYTFFILIFINITVKANNEQLTIGFGSCLNQKKPQEVWAAVEKENLSDFFFMGDNVYGDVNSGALKYMRSAYKRQKLNFPYFFDDINIHAVWDDHDYGLNDGGGDYKFKKRSKEMFLKFWNIHKDDARYKREGIYFSHKKTLGDLGINLIGLDTRYFRSKLAGRKGQYLHTKDKKTTLLGETQWLWLEKTLAIKSDLIIIVSSIQVIAKNHRFEKWYNFPHERKKLFDLIKKSQTPVILVSGDRHKSAIYKKDNTYELTSSSLNSPMSKIYHNKETDDKLIGKMHYDKNYGTIRVFKDGSISINLKNYLGKKLERIDTSIKKLARRK